MPISLRFNILPSISLVCPGNRNSLAEFACRLAMVPFAAVALFLALVLSTHATPNSAFEFAEGHWVGKSEWSEAGRFESCMVSEHNEADERLILRLDRSNSLTVGIFDKAWRDAGALEVQVLALADHRIFHFGSGLLLGNKILAFEITEPEISLAKLSEARLLSVNANDETVVFALAGADRALSYLLDCVRNGTAPVIAS